jgi:putative ABC transport system substrate-binding protein
LVGLVRDAAGYVDRIAQETKPADLPIAQPTHFDMTINVKTAASLGMVLSVSLTARPDDLIE